MLFGSIFLGKNCTGKEDRCTMFGCNNDRFFQLQLQLYSFTFNLQLHDSFHPLIGEPNRGGKEKNKFKERKEKKNYFTKQYQLSQNKNYSMY